MSTSGQRKNSLAKVKKFVRPSKFAIKVTLSDDQKDAFVPRYTSLDEINGQVSITAASETSFHNVFLTFEGSTKTFAEKVAATSAVTSKIEKSYTFIRLVHDDIALPNPRAFEAGQAYTFPFNFVVPHTLLPSSCAHKKAAGFPEDGHMALPPSLGDPMAASLGGSLASDMSPQMAKIGMLFGSYFFLSQDFSLHNRHALEEAPSNWLLYHHGVPLLPVRLPRLVLRFDLT